MRFAAYPEGLGPSASPSIGAPLASRRQRAKQAGKSLLREKTFVVGASIVMFWIVDAVLWRLMAPHDPQALNPSATLLPPAASHLFGTDNLGRDVFSRVLAGASSMLTIAPLATALGLLGGTAIGLVAGYYRGIVDDVL